MRAHVQAVSEPAALVAGDRAVLYDLVFDEYCLVREGGLDAAPISHCPWCGSVLPASKRDLWYAELARRGLSPDDEGLDEAFLSDAWWSRPLPPPERTRCDPSLLRPLGLRPVDDDPLL